MSSSQNTDGTVRGNLAIASHLPVTRSIEDVGGGRVVIRLRKIVTPLLNVNVPTMSPYMPHLTL